MIHQWIRTAAVAIIAAVVVWCAIPIHTFLETQAQAGAGIAAAIKTANQALNGKHTNGDDGLVFLSRNFLQNADSAMNALKQTAQSANAIAKDQKAKADQLTSESVALVKAGKESLDRLSATIDQAGDAIAQVKSTVSATGAQLNDGVLPALKDTLAGTTKALSVLDSPDGLIFQGASAIKSANVLLSDPHIPSMLAHIDSIAATSATSSEEISVGLGYINGYLKPSKPTLRGMIIAHGLPAILEFGIQELLRKFGSPERVELVK